MNNLIKVIFDQHNNPIGLDHTAKVLPDDDFFVWEISIPQLNKTYVFYADLNEINDDDLNLTSLEFTTEISNLFKSYYMIVKNSQGKIN